MINIDGSYYLDCDGDYVKVNVEYLTSSLMLRPNQDFARMTNAHFSAFAREFFSYYFCINFLAIGIYSYEPTQTTDKHNNDNIPLIVLIDSFMLVLLNRSIRLLNSLWIIKYI